MHLIGICCCALLVLACGKAKEEPAMDQGAAAPAADSAAMAPAAPAPISLADVAGKWKMRTTNEAGDSTLVEYSLDATADSTWVLHFPKRPPVKARVSASGDSIITEAGPYESVLRKGVQVKTTTVFRLQDGKLVGTTVAHYTTKGADSVRNLRAEGTRAQ